VAVRSISTSNEDGPDHVSQKTPSGIEWIRRKCARTRQADHGHPERNVRGVETEGDKAKDPDPDTPFSPSRHEHLIVNGLSWALQPHSTPPTARRDLRSGIGIHLCVCVFSTTRLFTLAASCADSAEPSEPHSATQPVQSPQFYVPPMYNTRTVSRRPRTYPSAKSSWSVQISRLLALAKKLASLGRPCCQTSSQRIRNFVDLVAY
jgi:hypothetical protein